jgi:hypothetical protein
MWRKIDICEHPKSLKGLPSGVQQRCTERACPRGEDHVFKVPKEFWPKGPESHGKPHKIE